KVGVIFLKQKARVYLSGLDYNAKGDYHKNTNRITILAGSKIKPSESITLHENDAKVENFKNKLMKEGVIVDNHFTVDYVFEDISHAAAIVSSNEKSGKKA